MIALGLTGLCLWVMRVMIQARAFGPAVRQDPDMNHWTTIFLHYRATTAGDWIVLLICVAMAVGFLLEVILTLAS